MANVKIGQQFQTCFFHWRMFGVEVPLRGDGLKAESRRRGADGHAGLAEAKYVGHTLAMVVSWNIWKTIGDMIQNVYQWVSHYG